MNPANAQFLQLTGGSVEPSSGHLLEIEVLVIILLMVIALVRWWRK